MSYCVFINILALNKCLDYYKQTCACVCYCVRQRQKERWRFKESLTLPCKQLVTWQLHTHTHTHTSYCHCCLFLILPRNTQSERWHSLAGKRITVLFMKTWTAINWWWWFNYPVPQNVALYMSASSQNILELIKHQLLILILSWEFFFTHFEVSATPLRMPQPREHGAFSVWARLSSSNVLQILTL